jgi:hypothetical protein
VGDGFHPLVDGGPPSAGCGRWSGLSAPARKGRVCLHKPTFNVTVVTFRMALLMKKFTNTAMDVG